MTDVKYPNVKVKLVGEDGNAFYIIARCWQAGRRAGIPDEELIAFRKEAMSGDYDHLLQTCMKWFNVE